MKTNRLLLAIALLLSFLFSHSVIAAEGAQAESFTPLPDRAAIYIYRNEYLGKNQLLPVVVNGMSVGSLLGYQYLRLDAKAGTYTFDSNSPKKFSLTLTVEAGKNYFIWQEAKLAPYGFRPFETQIYKYRTLFHKLDEDAGIKGMKECKLASQGEIADTLRTYNPTTKNTIARGEYKDSNGDVYTGELIDGEFSHGYGEKRASNGAVYEGAFIARGFAGWGILTLADGTVTEGYWDRGFFTGDKTNYRSIAVTKAEEIIAIFSKGITTGTDTKANDEAFIGDMLNGKFHGKGTLPFSNGDKYEGDFVNGQRTGKGKYYFAGGGQYEGDFVKGNMTGKGIRYYVDGSKYEGDFAFGFSAGEGILSFPSGDKYEGDFSNGKFHGKGKFNFANGDKYEGDFVIGQRTGKGIYYSANGNKFIGTFSAGKINAGDIYNSEGHVVAKVANGKPVNQQAASSQSDSSTIGDLLKLMVMIGTPILEGYVDAKQNQNTYRQTHPLPDSDILPSPSNSSSAPSRKVDSGCSSDFSCDFGSKCVKAPNSSTGVCMTGVDSYGAKTYDGPNPDSVGPRTSDGCRFSSDCPAGFTCDSALKACVK